MVNAISAMMKPMAAAAQQVGMCPRHLRPAALRRLHDSLPLSQQSIFTHALRKTGLADPAAWNGLLISRDAAERAASIGGVVWVQRVAGNTAVLWAPPGDGPVVEGLLSAAAAFIDNCEIPLAQITVDAHDGYSTGLLKLCGFPKLCELIYMYADVGQPALKSRPGGTANAMGRIESELRLEWVPHAGDDAERLGTLLEQTYGNTLDCPLLNGLRSMPEVLEGYRAQGRYAPQDWYFIRKNGNDVGTLILAEHPEFGNWELAYMGVAPQERGRGLGEAIVRFALEVAAERGGERLVLAVDEANTPARKAYAGCGLHEWDRRLVYARLHHRT